MALPPLDASAQFTLTVPGVGGGGGGGGGVVPPVLNEKRDITAIAGSVA